MASPEPELTEEERKKKTVWLMAGGAASLLLPLLGLAYLHMTDGGSGAAPGGRSDLFERRDAGQTKILPSQAAVPPSAMAVPAAAPAASSLSVPQGSSQRPSESSLDFIKPNAEMQGRVAADAPKAATATVAAAAPAPAPAPAKAAAAKKGTEKPGKKSFAMPKLQPTRGFSSMGGAKSGGAPAPAPAAAGGGQDDMMKNLPPGAANDPRVQQYLQNQGK